MAFDDVGVVREKIIVPRNNFRIVLPDIKYTTIASLKSKNDRLTKAILDYQLDADLGDITQAEANEGIAECREQIALVQAEISETSSYAPEYYAKIIVEDC